MSALPQSWPLLHGAILPCGTCMRYLTPVHTQTSCNGAAVAHSSRIPAPHTQRTDVPATYRPLPQTHTDSKALPVSFSLVPREPYLQE